ncbi:MAG: hypothetical protein EFT35_02880 [Methanophagales archaeon ANME-1-THS]|nr:MAG: hypothetical protein EFT35_02880 [Methanophagales archaeon ANME-1-THS]
MHKCLRCGRKFERIVDAMLTGCPECGGNLFLYIRAGEDVRAADLVDRITIDARVPVEGEKIESLRILSPGIYELNLDALLERKGIIMGLKGDGSYAIHLPSLFRKKKDMRR